MCGFLREIDGIISLILIRYSYRYYQIISNPEVGYQKRSPVSHGTLWMLKAASKIQHQWYSCVTESRDHGSQVTISTWNYHQINLAERYIIKIYKNPRRGRAMRDNITFKLKIYTNVI